MSRVLFLLLVLLDKMLGEDFCPMNEKSGSQTETTLKESKI